jgi:hypothetical protein
MPGASGDRYHERLLMLLVGSAAIFLGGPLLRNFFPRPTADTPIGLYLALFAGLSLVLLAGGLHLVFRALGVRVGPLGRRLEDQGSPQLTERLHVANVLTLIGLGVLTVQATGEWFPFNLGVALAIVSVATLLHELLPVAEGASAPLTLFPGRHRGRRRAGLGQDAFTVCFGDVSKASLEFLPRLDAVANLLVGCGGNVVARGLSFRTAVADVHVGPVLRPGAVAAAASVAAGAVGLGDRAEDSALCKRGDLSKELLPRVRTHGRARDGSGSGPRRQGYWR